MFDLERQPWGNYRFLFLKLATGALKQCETVRVSQTARDTLTESSRRDENHDFLKLT
jgi:hypothetical protein